MCTSKHTYVHIYVCLHIHMYIYTYICMCTYTHMHIYTCVNVYLYYKICSYTFIHVHIRHMSFAEYRLFYRALLQKRPIIFSIHVHIRHMYSLLHLECHFFTLTSQSMIKFSESFFYVPMKKDRWN